MPEPIDDQTAAIVAAELQKANQASAEFDQSLTDTRNRFASIYQEMLAPKQTPLLPEIQEIVSALQGQPRLIPAVQKFLRDKVSAINAAIATVLEEQPPPL